MLTACRGRIYRLRELEFAVASGRRPDGGVLPSCGKALKLLNLRATHRNIRWFELAWMPLGRYAWSTLRSIMAWPAHDFFCPITPDFFQEHTLTC